MKLWEGNVFSRVCVHRGIPMWPLPMMYLTLLYRAASPQPCPMDIKNGWPWPPTSYIWRPSLETCSNLFTWGPPSPTSTDNWWPPKHVRLAFLLECFLVWLCEIDGLCLGFPLAPQIRALTYCFFDLSKLATSAHNGTIPFLVLCTTNATAFDAISLSSTKVSNSLLDSAKK